MQYVRNQDYAYNYIRLRYLLPFYTKIHIKNVQGTAFGGKKIFRRKHYRLDKKSVFASVVIHTMIVFYSGRKYILRCRMVFSNIFAIIFEAM